MNSRASVVYVAYRSDQIDTAWIPDEAQVFVVHNDAHMRTGDVRHPGAVHIFCPQNVGFGAAVNLALAQVGTERVILCNPDTQLTPAHWTVLASGAANELVTVPLVDGEGRPTSVINRYPTPLYMLLSAYKVGRFLKRGSAGRNLLAPLLGPQGREHVQLTEVTAGQWPLADYWPSAAVLSLDAERFRAVEGFDPSYFLYIEDLDLAVRLRQRFADMLVVLAETPPGVHAVGQSSSGRQTRRLRELSSMKIYAARQRGVGWRAAGLAMQPLSAWWAWRQRSVE